MTHALVEIRDVLAKAMEFSPPNHPHVGSEHLALVAWDGPDGLAMLAQRLGVDALRLASTLRNCCRETLERSRTGEPAITARTAAAAALASQIAISDGAPAIGSGHLLLALLEDPGAIAWRGIRAGGLTLTAVHDGVVATRSQPMPSPGPRAPRQLHRELAPAVAGWEGYVQALVGGQVDAVDAVAAAWVGAARAYVADLAALGGRRGLLTPAEVIALTGDAPDVAGAAFRLATVRWQTLAAAA